MSTVRHFHISWLNRHLDRNIGSTQLYGPTYDPNQFLKVSCVLLVKLRWRIEFRAVSTDERKILFIIEFYYMVNQLILYISAHVLHIMVTTNSVEEGVRIILWLLMPVDLWSKVYVGRTIQKTRFILFCYWYDLLMAWITWYALWLSILGLSTWMRTY